MRDRFENVFDPEQPLKLYPTVIDVTFSSGETTTAIDLPWDVVPFHTPSYEIGELEGPEGDAQEFAAAHSAIVRKIGPGLDIIQRAPESHPGNDRNKSRPASTAARTDFEDQQRHLATETAPVHR